MPEQLRIVHQRCNQTFDPEGIGADNPRLSWEIESD
jgi:hypothetical protein